MCIKGGDCSHGNCNMQGCTDCNIEGSENG